jgi:acetylornithine aminotransferase
MALRILSKRASFALRAPRVNCVSPRFASAASAALKGSSLPQDVKDSIAVSEGYNKLLYSFRRV